MCALAELCMCSTLDDPLKNPEPGWSAGIISSLSQESHRDESNLCAPLPCSADAVVVRLPRVPLRDTPARSHGQPTFTHKCNSTVA